MYKVSKYNINFKIKDEEFLYNSISKSFLKTSKKFNIEEELSKINFSNYNNQELIKNGFVIEEDVDELSNIDFLYRKIFLIIQI